MENKPFPCNIEGCDKSFVTEDHLTVHRKKHDLNLKGLSLELSNKANVFADQTPTPTRLIKNCEEVGLFEDLRNVNPFEETFRRAIDEKCANLSTIEEKDKIIGSATHLGDILNTEPCSDTLHTPHIFPHYHSDRKVDNEANPIDSRQKCLSDKRIQNNKNLKNSLDKRKKGLDKSLTNINGSPSKLTAIEPKLKESEKNSDSEKRPIVFPSSDIDTIKISNKRRKLKIEDSLKNRSIGKITKVLPILPKPEIKPHILIRCITADDNIVLGNSHSIAATPSNDQGSAKNKLRELLSKKNITHDKSTNVPQKVQVVDSTNTGSSSDLGNVNKHSANNKPLKDEHISERNREAAKRYRNKKKQRQNILEKRNNQLEHENSQLKMKNSQLKSEVNRLKNILELHSNCILNNSVTTGIILHPQSKAAIAEIPIKLQPSITINM